MGRGPKVHLRHARVNGNTMIGGRPAGEVVNSCRCCRLFVQVAANDSFRVTLRPEILGFWWRQLAELSSRVLSSVEDKGNRSVLPGTYHLSLGSTQPGETTAKSGVDFSVTGTAPLPK